MAFYNNVIAGAAGSGGAAGYKIERSLRFNSADTAQLSTRFNSFTDINTGTISFWVKRATLGAGVIAAGWDGGVSYSGSIQFNSSDNCLQVSMGGSAAHTFKTNATLRDVSSWYHVVAAWDRSASAADKVKVWINGVAQTSSDTGYQSWTSGNCQIWAANNGNRIGRGDADRYLNQLNGYLAEYHYVDGQALDETSFGEYDNNNLWQPKDCKDDLTYGTAGFYLSFSDTSSNSALGLDQRPGATQDPTATTYGEVNGGNVTMVFDGVLGSSSELQLRPNGAGVTLDTPVTATSSVRIYGSSEGTANARYQINGTNTSAVPLTYPSRGWTTISGLSFPITINSFGIGGGSGNDGARLSAIEIDGTVLTGTANDWTVNNLDVGSAGTTLSAATGASPILNTSGDYGGTATSGVRSDSNSSNIVLALPLNGSSGSTTIADYHHTVKGSGSAKAITVFSGSSSGGAVIDTSQSQYYGSSFYVARGGVNQNQSDYITRTGDTDLNLGTGDFTVEFWYRPKALHSNVVMFDNRHPTNSWPNSSNGFALVGAGSGHMYLHTGGNNRISTAPDLVAGEWTHIAITRDGGTTTFRSNGVNRGSFSDSNNYNEGRFTLGSSSPNGEGSDGHFADLRIYKGVAKYTSDFTVPSSPDYSNSDSLFDSPTDYEADSGNNGGNYCTLNVLDKRSTVTLSNGNLDATTSTSHWSGVKGTIGVSSGKYYYEVTYGNGNAGRIFVGICGHDVDIDPGSYVQDDTTERAKGMLLFCDDGRYQLDTASRVNMTSQPVTGDVIGVAFDLDNNTAQFYKNGAALGSIDISGSTLASTTVVPIVVVYQSGVKHNFNSGQRPFAYPVSGYSSICTTNLPDPLIKDPSTEFDVDTWSGDNTDPRSRTLSFGPDLIWVKTRNQTNWHYITDSVRGAPNKLYTNSTNAEDTAPIYGQIDSFNSDGFTLGGGTDSSNPLSDSNQSGTSYVAWAWDGGDLATTSDTTNYNQSQSLSAVTKAGSTTYSPTDSNTGFLNAYPPSNAFNGSGINGVCYTNNNNVWIYVQLSTAITVSSTIKFGARNTVEVKINGTDYSYTGGDSTANQTTRTISFSGSLTEFAIRDDDNSGYSTGLSFLEVDGKQLIDPGVITVGSLNSSVYNTSRTWSSGIANPSGDFDQAATNAFNGDRSNKLRTGGNSVLVTLNFSPALTVSNTIQILGEDYATADFRYTVTVDGTTTTKDVNQGQPATFNVSGSLTQITVDNNSSGGRTYLEWIKVDGKELIDSTATPPNLPSIASTVRANPSAGFSISSYVGNGTSGSTVSHGLNGAVPKMVIFKNRDASADWRVYHTMADGSLDILYLNSSINKNNSSLNTHTGNVFHIGSSTSTNGNGNDIIAYSFAPIEGYSAFGSYTGNGLADGPFIYTGFQVRFLLRKESNATNHWHIVDTARDPENATDSWLFPNLSDAEASGDSDRHTDILSNGFKIRSAYSYHNTSGATYIYAAFAEHPFKTARAR